MDKLTWLDEKNDFLFIYCYTQKLETQISKSIWCHAFGSFDRELEHLCYASLYEAELEKNFEV